MLPEGRASPDMIFPEAGLRFMKAKGGSGSDGCPVRLPTQSLLVQPVPSFVQHTVERLGEILFVVSRGQPAIARPHTRTERMGRRINAARLEIKADSFGHFTIEGLLAGDGIMAGQLLPRNWRGARHRTS